MKYEPLKRYLDGRLDAGPIRLSFAEIDDILGFRLPRSARDHQAWWSNTRIGHSHAAAWLDADWKTTALDLAGGAVTFVKAAVSPGLAEEGTGFPHPGAEIIALSPDALDSRALRMIDGHVARHGGDRASACIALLDQLANDRLAAMVEWFQKASPPSTISSADLIREDRDAR
jgi:hypothetical protein